MLSGPHAFREFRLRRTPTTSISESWILESSGIDDVEGKGDLLNDSELLGLKTEWKKVFKVFAISNLSVVNEYCILSVFHWAFYSRPKSSGILIQGLCKLDVVLGFFLLIICFVKCLKFLYIARLAGLGDFLSFLLCMFFFLLNLLE
jgi:hypothetical protein